MALTEKLRFVLEVAGADQARRELSKVGAASDDLDKLDQRANQLLITGGTLVGFAGAAGAALFAMGQDASNLEQAVGGTQAVFGDFSGTIDAFATTSAESFGLSEQSARELTSQLGALLTGAGLTKAEAADFSVTIAQLGTDLAATFGGAPEEAVDALGAAFRGEFDSLERFGVSLRQSEIDLRAVELGLADSTGEVGAQERALATYNLILERTADFQGQAGREADTAAGQQARLKAQFEDLRAELGGAVLPIMSELAGRAADLVGGFSSLNESTGGLLGQLATFGTIGVGAVGGLSAVTGAALKARDNLGALSTIIRGAAGLNPAMLAVGAVTAAAGLAIAAFGRDADASEAKAKALADAVRDLSGDFETLAVDQLVEGPGVQHAIDLLNGLGISVGDIAEAFDGSERSFDEFYKSVLGGGFGIESTIRQNAAAALEAGEATNDYERQLLELVATNEITIPQASAFAGAISEVQRSLAGAGGELRAETEALLANAVATETLTDKQAAKFAADLEAASSAEAVRAVYADVTGALEAAATSTTGADEATSGLTSTVSTALGTLSSWSSEIDVAREAADLNRQAEEERQAAIDEITGALEEARDAQLDYVSAVLEGALAANGFAQQEIATAESVNEYRAAVELANTATGEAGVKAQQDLATQLLTTEERVLRQAEAAAELAGETASAADKAAIQRQQLQAVANTLAPGDPLRARLSGYIRELDSVASDVSTQARLDEEQARRELRSYNAELDRTNGRVVTNYVDTVYRTRGGRLARARGGPVPAGAVSLVGEEGPELVAARIGATGVDVLSASQTRGALSRAPTAAAANVTVNVATQSSPDQIARAVTWALMTSGR